MGRVRPPYWMLYDLHLNLFYRDGTLSTVTVSFFFFFLVSLHVEVQDKVRSSPKVTKGQYKVMFQGKVKNQVC